MVNEKDTSQRSGITVRRMTSKRLNKLALNYCKKYIVSSKRLSEYLLKRVYLEEKDSDKKKILSEEIHKITNRMIEFGLVNDYEAASAKLRCNLKSGYAPAMAVSFAAKRACVDLELVEDILPEAIRDSFQKPCNDCIEEDIDDVLLARLALKRRRRGPFRVSGRSVNTDKRDIGWLQRRGYTFDIIRKAMELSD